MLTPGTTEAERAGLLGSLGRVDPAVLLLLQRQGVHINVARAGQDFDSLGLLQPRTAESYTAQLPQAREAIERALASTAGLDQQLRELQARRAELGGAGDLPPFNPDGTPPQYTEAQQQWMSLGFQIMQLESQRRQTRSEVLGADNRYNPPAIPFTLPRTGPPRPFSQEALDEIRPKSTAEMAGLVGARTPEQYREYNRLVEELNGDRLREARAETIRGAEERLAGLSGEERTQAEMTLAAYRQFPEMVPVDTQRGDIFVPNLFFTPDGQRLNLHDAVSSLSWTSPDGRVAPPATPETPGTTMLGQYFPGARGVLVSERSALGVNDVSGDTPIHELGHAIDHAVRDRDPGFYRDWSARLGEAHAAARAGGGLVTEYAGNNLGEYIAEGVSHYYDDPTLLRSTDPALYSLTEELLLRAAELGR